MNKTLLTVLAIIVFSILAFVVMHYVIGFTLRKALIISGSAGAAMIFFDVVLLNLIRKR